MFTGIVEEIGIIKGINKGAESASITIGAKNILEDVKLGDSIATNGVCLTVTHFTKDSFTVDVMPETMRKSSLSNISIGSKVNLERALKLSDRLGGHIVSGHIDGTGVIKEFKKEDNAVWISIEAHEEILKYIINKGSIAIDGVSLTVAYVDKKMFKVSIIPHTGEETTLLNKKIGDKVNLECDLIGKYVERLSGFNSKEENKSPLDLNFLSEHGFY
ncbi:Riboflavin synthase [Clostridium liquoris]|uniref:Riboflavin synthase n=1 Tax=Clostridium liquoris TaxID=1289519 RepID=A0A2T0B3J7_9CLOT|nr:riboflavin synthase [Clostridium liquoris]PRR78327.1 Riboflavin synthase [Clostridium liquoris]